MTPFQFDARTVPPASADGNAPLPIGEWPMIITASEIVQNAQKTGGYVKFKVVIIDGEHKGHEGFYRLNMYHENAKTVEIARKQMSALCYVTQKFMLNQLDDLHNIPFIGVVKSNATEEYPNATQINGVKDIQGNDPGKKAQTQPQAAPQQQPQQFAQPPQGNVSAPTTAQWAGQPQPQQQAPQQPAQWTAPQPAQQPTQPAGWVSGPAQAAAPQQPAWGPAGSVNNQQAPAQGGQPAYQPGAQPPWGQQGS